MKYVFLFAVVVFAVGVYLAVVNTDADGEPSTTWIQAGVATSLLVVTAAYAVSADRSLSELKESRYDSQKPVISMRQLIENGNISTYLYNVGSGVAVNITVWTNRNPGLVYIDKSHKKSYKTKMAKWPDNNYVFGMPLGVHTGNADTQIHFITGRSPLQDENAEYIIEYSDVYGRFFITHLKRKLQVIHGPYSQSEKQVYINKNIRELLSKTEAKRIEEEALKVVISSDAKT